MGTLLASDDQNPEFVGAHNPDSKLAVMFYRRAEQDSFRSEAEGKPVFFDVDYVKIFTPGNQLNIVDTPVREEHKKRFPMHWAHYQNQKGAEQLEIGTPLSQWPRLTVSQVEELRVRKFYTVENIANASDLALQSLGMIAGMSPHAFRDHAKRFLELARGDAVAKAAEDKAAELLAKNEALQAQIAASNEAMAKMQEQVTALAAAQAAQVTEPKKRGRPPKAKPESMPA